MTASSPAASPLPEPFAYPKSKHVRRHGPAGYADWSRFKQWLRDEFTYRCIYCLFRERWYPNGHASFGVEHIVARSVDPALEFTYSNLAYACNRCNSAKGDENLGDPCKDPLGAHLTVNADGQVEATTTRGREIVDTLGLNNPTVVEYRVLMLEVLDLAEPKLLLRFFGYPSDVPDLKKPRPKKNSRLAGVKKSAHAVKLAGKLPLHY